MVDHIIIQIPLQYMKEVEVDLVEVAMVAVHLLVV